MKQVQIRGGTTHDHMVGPNEKGFIGLPREITIDTNLWTIRVHDGLTAGGFLLAKLAEVYTKPEIDQKIIEIVSGGEINLDGYATKSELNQKSNLDHVHEQYSAVIHDHPDKASLKHQHDTSDVYFEDGETLLQKYNNKTLSNVNMADYVTNEVFNLHKHEQYSPITHEHTEYSLTSHDHNSTYSNIGHKHSNYLEIDIYNESVELLSRIGHIHKSEEITHNTQLLSEYLNNLSVEGHTHNTNQITYNNTNLTSFLEKHVSEFSSHEHNKTYYTKDEINEFLLTFKESFDNVYAKLVDLERRIIKIEEGNVSKASAICGTFTAGELKCNEGVSLYSDSDKDKEEFEAKSFLSEQFKNKFGVKK